MTEGQTAVLGPDGKVISINQTTLSSSPTFDMKMNLTCKKCKYFTVNLIEEIKLTNCNLR